MSTYVPAATWLPRVFRDRPPVPFIEAGMPVTRLAGMRAVAAAGTVAPIRRLPSLPSRGLPPV